MVCTRNMYNGIVFSDQNFRPCIYYKVFFVGNKNIFYEEI